MTTATAAIPQALWTIDPSHSNVSFAIKHMGIATVRGRFAEFAGRIDTTGSKPALEGSVEVASVDTGNEQRDAHLAAPDFFDAERSPTIKFQADSVEFSGEGINIAGEISIRGVSRPISLSGTVAGPDTDPWGNERIGISASGEIDRRNFGLDWNQPLPSGKSLLGNAVKFTVDISATKEA